MFPWPVFYCAEFKGSWKGIYCQVKCVVAAGRRIITNRQPRAVWSFHIWGRLGEDKNLKQSSKSYRSALRRRNSCGFVTEYKGDDGEDEGDGSRRLVSYLHFPPSPLAPSTTAPPPQQHIRSRRRRYLLFTAGGKKKPQKNTAVFTTWRDAAFVRDFLWPRLR